MNKIQWIVLSVGFFLLGAFFIQLDSNNGHLPYGKVAKIVGNPCTIIEDLLWERYQSGNITQDEWYEKQSSYDDLPLSEYDVLCVVGGEMYEPFIYLTWFGHIMCLMMVFLEPKWYKKKIKK
jgi:hypothetical protein